VPHAFTSFPFTIAPNSGILRSVYAVSRQLALPLTPAL